MSGGVLRVLVVLATLVVWTAPLVSLTIINGCSPPVIASTQSLRQLLSEPQPNGRLSLSQSTEQKSSLLPANGTTQGELAIASTVVSELAITQVRNVLWKHIVPFCLYYCVLSAYEKWPSQNGVPRTIL